MPAPRYWSQAQRKLFITLCLQNVPRDVIAERLGGTVRQINSLYYSMRKHRGFRGVLAPRATRAPICTPEHFETLTPEIRRLSAEGVGHRAIADQLRISRHRVLKYVRAENLIPEDHLKNRPAHRPQDYTLPVNLHRVRLAEVDEADVKLARMAWREFEKAS